MKNIGTQRLETDRLILRRFTEDDITPSYRNWCCDPEVTKFLTWPTHSSEKVTEKVLKSWMESYSDPVFYQWAIEFKELGEVIGTISVVNISADTCSMEVGYCIGKKWWHKGITSEAFAAVIDYLFAEIGLERISARYDPNNPHSGDVMKKCGLRYEGTLRKADKNNQGIVDACWYGILREEWKGKGTEPSLCS